MATDERLEGLVNAPDFPGHLEWLNTSKKYSLKDFRGKFVLLDFWTYCCINCMHVIPDLKRLEKKYPEELVVIGVHSAKFQNEKDTDQIRQAILRYEIEHPVLNDKDFEVWRAYGASAWPTLFLLNPNGKIVGSQSGEDIFELFDNVIARGIEYFDRKGQLKRSPVKLELEKAGRPNTLLAFPGKISADSTSRRLFITDSNHNRIIVTDSEGAVLDSIGSGEEGSKDGSFETAAFHHPQGAFLQGDILYIADTENHLIRTADFKTREVKTILGTGKKATAFNRPGKGTKAPLNSPWDLLVYEDKLYIAMAGFHQIWIADLKTLEAKPFAGSGREARVDGPLLQAALAQPSGITMGSAKLYFADSEVSSVRSADLDPKGKVETLIGEDLFEFGDIDGTREVARLQHALGVLYHAGQIYAADTYNSKIKVIDLFKKTSTTFAGTGRHGLKNGERLKAQFNEPGGLAVIGDGLYIADTNNHQIRTLDLKTGEVANLELKNLERLLPRKPGEKEDEDKDAKFIQLPSQRLAPGQGKLFLDLILPPGYKWTPKSPFMLNWKSSDAAVRFKNDGIKIDSEKISFPYEISFDASPGMSEVTVNAVIFYCTVKASVCFFDDLRIKSAIEVTGDAPTNAATLSVQVPVKKPNLSQ